MLIYELYDLGNECHEGAVVERAEPICFLSVKRIVLLAGVNKGDVLTVFCGLKTQRKGVCLLSGDNKNIIKH